jgi:SAM-dependent methyltransferase
MDRAAFLLDAAVPGATRIIEVGPSISPIAPKGEGWRTTVVDHADADTLRRKYAKETTDRIEEVDIVWNGGALHDQFPAESHGTYDLIIASHVIEHLLDPIGLFMSADRLLSPSGKLALAVPDKRLCFDALRPVSSVGQFLAAHLHPSRKHRVASVYDSVAYAVQRPDEAEVAWTKWMRPSIGLIAAPFEVNHLCATYDEAEGDYLDVHAWTFTPASFDLLVFELRAMGRTGWTIKARAEPGRVEFLVVLERAQGPAPERSQIQSERQVMLRRMLMEIRDQANWWGL